MAFHLAKEAQKLSVHFHRCHSALGNREKVKYKHKAYTVRVHVLLCWDISIYNCKADKISEICQACNTAGFFNMFFGLFLNQVIYLGFPILKSDMTAQLQRANWDPLYIFHMGQMQTEKGYFTEVLLTRLTLLIAPKKVGASGEASPTFILVPPFASLLSGEASVLILHFSLSTFFQHLEDTFSGAGVHRGPGENCATQMVHTKKKNVDIVLDIAAHNQQKSIFCTKFFVFFFFSLWQRHQVCL